MKYLFDTCLVSELVRKAPEPKVAKWVAECEEDAAFLSVLTIGEIQKGISRLNEKKKKAFLQNWLDSHLRERFKGRILPISEDIAQTWGLMQGEAESKGKSISTMDGLIGATALAHNLTVVTRNESDLRPTGAKVLNPWSL